MSQTIHPQWSAVESLEPRLLLSGEINLALDNASIQENATVALTGTLVTPVAQPASVSINWGDGSDLTTVDLVAGDTTFSAQHLYAQEPASGTAYTITTVLGEFTATTTVTVTNAAPEILMLSVDPASINEDDFTMLTGTFADAGTLDSHSVTIDWGDGQTQTLALDVGARGFGANHQYADDGASGTASDVYTVAVSLTDGAAADTQDVSVTVNNVAPAVYDLQVNPVAVDENGVATLTGSFTDPGTLDTHTVAIDWGDGATQELTLAVGQRNFTADHQYLDDGISGTPSDVYAVNVSVTDDDTGVGLAATTVTVNNVAPEIYHLDLTPVAIDENGVATLTGNFTDPGTLDTHTVTINWGDGSAVETIQLVLGDRAFSATHQYLDDNPTGTPSDVYTVNVSVTDDDTGVGMSATTITVNNVAPVITAITSSAPGVGDAAENEVITIGGAFTDVGTLDTHTAVINWGDGSTAPATIVQGAGSGTFAGSHAYATGGIYTITLTLTDDDTGTAVATTTAVISGVGIHNGVLQIIGTDAADRVHVNTFRGGSKVRVQASFLADGKKRDLDFAGVTRIETLLGDGDDKFDMAGNMTTLTVLDGGAGDDFLNVGAGPAVITGGEGRDRIMSGHGKGGGSILIGGTGSDVIMQHVKSADVIVGGSTTLDPNDDALTADFAAGLLDVLANWNSAASRDAGIAKVGQTLSLGTTVLDDGVLDSILGGKGKAALDWVIDEVAPVIGKGNGKGNQGQPKGNGNAQGGQPKGNGNAQGGHQALVIASSVVNTAKVAPPAPVAPPTHGNKHTTKTDNKTTTPTPPVDVTNPTLPPTLNQPTHGNGHGNGNGNGNGKGNK